MEEKKLDELLVFNFLFWKTKIVKFYQNKLCVQETFLTNYTIDSKDTFLKIVESYINSIDLITFSIHYFPNVVHIQDEERGKQGREQLVQLRALLKYFNDKIDYETVCELFYSIKTSTITRVIDKIKLKTIFSRHLKDVKKLIDFSEKLRYRDRFIKKRMPSMVGARIFDKEEIEEDLKKEMPTDQQVDEAIEKEETDKVLSEEHETVVEFDK